MWEKKYTYFVMANIIAVGVSYKMLEREFWFHQQCFPCATHSNFFFSMWEQHLHKAFCLLSLCVCNFELIMFCCYFSCLRSTNFSTLLQLSLTLRVPDPKKSVEGPRKLNLICHQGWRLRRWRVYFSIPWRFRWISK